MTARPRAWTTTTPDDPVEWVRVVEWDREKVVPVIADALRTYGSQREAEAIFDALDREQT